MRQHLLHRTVHILIFLSVIAPHGYTDENDFGKAEKNDTNERSNSVKNCLNNVIILFQCFLRESLVEFSVPGGALFQYNCASLVSGLKHYSIPLLCLFSPLSALTHILLLKKKKLCSPVLKSHSIISDHGFFFKRIFTDHRALNRGKSVSNEDLADDDPEPCEWKRVSKIRRSLQYPKVTSPAKYSSRPLDLPENLVSVSRIRQELENGRRLDRAMRNNHVDLAALDSILKGAPDPGEFFIDLHTQFSSALIHNSHTSFLCR